MILLHFFKFSFLALFVFNAGITSSEHIDYDQEAFDQQLAVAAKNLAHSSKKRPFRLKNLNDSLGQTAKGHKSLEALRTGGRTRQQK